MTQSKNYMKLIYSLNSRQKKITSLFCCVIVALFFSFFSSSKIIALSMIGDFMMGCIALVSLVFLLLNINAIKFNKRYIVLYLIFFIYQIVLCFANFNNSIFTVIGQSLTIFAIILMIPMLDKTLALKIINCMMLLLLLFCYIDLIIHINIEQYLFFTNPNKMGMIGFFSFLFNLLLSKHNLFFYINIVLCFVVVVLSDARTPLLCLLIVFVMYLFFSKRILRKNVDFMFVAICILMILFTWLYIAMSKNEIGAIINEIIYKYTGKNFFSGRQRIWREFFDAANPLNLIFGYGTGTRLSAIVPSETISTHNQYIEIILQYGVVGLFVFICFLNAIWKSIVKSGDKKRALYAVFFIGIIIYNVFEVMLIQNNFSISILSWIMFMMPQNSEKNITKRG